MKPHNLGPIIAKILGVGMASLLVISCPGVNGPSNPEETSITIVSANLTSGTLQSYENEGIRIFQALDPDVALLQEFNNVSGSIRDLVDEAFGDQFYYSVGTGVIPNGVVSRYPILDSSFWDDPTVGNRELEWSIIDIPGERGLFVVSVHLSTDSFSQHDAAVIVANQIASHKTNHPGGYHYLVGGTFNGSAAVSSSGIGLNGNIEIGSPPPVDILGDSDTNASRTDRNDWLLFGVSLEEHEVALTSGAWSYAHGMVFDSRLYTQSELDLYYPPVQVNDSGAAGMSHMAIVRRIEY